ncbi:MAG: glycosyltransferase [Bacteroidetes bacterium]|jgi:glycosyltransferase involved in cell wall biosynthesis|nr:glycosyltransferase [Bacteroidota bacterium]
MNEKKDVSIIICTYNEEKTVADVVRTCVENNPPSEVIVVDDGSEDSSEEILKELQQEISFNYIKLPENKGKSFAMAKGVEESTRDIILFFDADVTGIKPEHYDQLLQPVFVREADMVLGQPSETLIDYRINPFKGLTGERALRKEHLLPILDDIREIAFGVETYMNLYFQAHGKKIKYLILDGLTHPTKYKKTTAVNATMEFLSEGREIAQTLLKNYDLITKRIEYSMDAHNELIKQKILVLQNDLNERIKAIFKREK